MGATVVAVAFTARALVPEMPWAAAVALGAIVAPPDAAAATAVLRIIPVPYQVRTILEGESLFNDASSLLIYRFALTAAIGATPEGWNLAGSIVWSLGGSVVFGIATAWLSIRLTRLLTDAPSAILMPFITTFGVWIAAERLGLSAIVTTVVFGMTAARFAARGSATIRAPAYAVWETVVSGLNVLAFMLVGLQIGPIWQNLDDAQRQGYVVFALTILGVCVGMRIICVLGYHFVVDMKNRLVGANLPGDLVRPTWSGASVIAWAGVRGIVSLATAYALPAEFPQRDLIQIAVFAVVIGTLVGQALTLGPFIRVLGLNDDGVLERDIRKAREAIADAALTAVAGRGDPAAERLRAEYQERRDALRDAEGDGRVRLPVDHLAKEVLAAKRLLKMRLSGEISDAAYYQLEEELDRHQMALMPVVR